MRFLSVCSGIDAPSVAWSSLGWTPVAFSEIASFPSAVLATRQPGVANWGDLTRYEAWPDDAAIDLLIGGTPCQSFSIAGLRDGLVDPRGALALVYLAIARKYRPRWLVWENVAGVLSLDNGRPFGTLLGGLAELGYGFSYRVLDAQYFGVPQRRRRVFVVAHAGDWRRSAAVLLERSSLSGDRAPGDDAGQDDCPGDAGDAARRIPRIANGLTHRMHKGVNTTMDEGQTMIADATGVRVLTPLECERVQGFPDHYTRILYRGRRAADSHRYKALGNAMAVPVIAWIGRRIAMVDAL